MVRNGQYERCERSAGVTVTANYFMRNENAVRKGQGDAKVIIIYN